MANNATPQQQAAIERQGRVIVSASAGSGKTFVMIRRLADLIENGGDLDGVLAVTFTKKAAAQMKEKLRAELIKRSSSADEKKRAHIKAQLNKISSANISTIHSFCGYLLRVYFYILDIDGSFEVVSEDGGAQAQLRSRATDALFDRLYEEENGEFLYLVERYGKKRTDSSLKKLLADAYDRVRNIPDYVEFLNRTAEGVTERSFNDICGQIYLDGRTKCTEMAAEITDFVRRHGDIPEAYKKIIGEMQDILAVAAAQSDIFSPLPKFATSRKPPVKKGETDPFAEEFGALRDYIKGRYDKLYEGLSDRGTELEMFLESGTLARAFCHLLLAFDEAYSAAKREEGKLDYGDMEHLTLRLLQTDGMLGEIRSRFSHVFVDEYQDVNPVQERIISLIGGQNLFLVGDVKQAIYGFRGSKSEYFTRKFAEFGKAGSALLLSHNFRSSPKVIQAVNSSFSQLMRPETCGIDYANDSVMISGGAYPEGSGGAYLHIFGKDEKQAASLEGVYSVAAEELKKAPPTREGLAVLEIVRRELESTFYDVEEECTRRVEPGDICILTRKRDNASASGIIRALTAAGFSVSGAQGGNAFDCPEVKQITDILSYLDNGEQDIPFASALLSPLGGLTEEELAKIKITCGGAPVRLSEGKERMPNFRDCCNRYISAFGDETSAKLRTFVQKVKYYRNLASLFGAGTVIDALLQDTALEAEYFRGGGAKLKNIRRLAQAAYTPAGELSINAFLAKLKAGGFNLSLAESGGGESIKVMTMHSSKGLEFPVVILADVTRPYRGKNDGSLPLDEQFGFAHKYFDMQKRVCTPTVLGRLCRLKDSREEVRNEMNLLYVACTRAKYRLHIMSQEDQAFNPARVTSATNYAQMLNFSCFERDEVQGGEFSEQQPRHTLISQPDGQMLSLLREHFMQPYAHAESIDLPVKSSASAILRLGAQDEYYAENTLFPEEEREGEESCAQNKSEGKGQFAHGGTGIERGVAYHRFLQLCDFAVKDEEGIAREIEQFSANGLLAEGQAGLLSAANLSHILHMPCFGRTAGAAVFREREFLCALPADSFMQTSSHDEVLVQGAIDLLCVNGGNVTIIDYKYSAKPDDLLVTTYRPQLDLYRLAVEKIMRVPRENIGAYIVNINLLHEIKLY